MRKDHHPRNVFPLNRRTLAAISASLAAAGLLAPGAHAQTTWDGGGANTNWSTAANWDKDTAPSAGASLTFGSGGSTATLDGSYSVGTLTFNRAGDFTINRAAGSSFALTINTGITVSLQNRTNRTYTISTPLILGGDNLWNFGNNNQGGSTGAVFLSGGISEVGGSRSVTKTGLGPVTLTAAGTYTGSTTINNGVFNLANNSATLSSSAVFLNGGTNVALNVTNNATTDDTPINRIASLSLSGGEFKVTAPAGFRTREVISGAVTIGSGHSIITADANNRRTVIEAASLSRSAGGFTLFRGDALGASAANAGGTSTESNIVFTSAPGSTLFAGGGGATGSAQISILPWAVGDSPGSWGSGFVTYDAGADGVGGTADDRGIRLLSTATEYAPTVSGAATGDNVRIAANDTLAAGTAKTVNSLLVAGGGTGGGPALTLGAGSTLTVSSGALLLAGTPNAGIVGSGTVNFGSATEAFITATNTGDTKEFAANLQGAANTYKYGDATLDISGVISDNGSTATSLIAAQGRLTLSNPANTYSGTTTVERGRLQLAASAMDGSGSLGTSNTPIILGTDRSTPSEHIELFLNSGVTLGRDVEARQAQVGNPDGQRFRIGVETGTATVDTSSRLMLGAPAGTGTSRRMELIAVHQDAVLDFKGEIAQSGSAYNVLINGSNAGKGTVRLSNSNNSYSVSTQLVVGTLLLGASVPSSGNSVIGTGGLSLGEGATQANSTLRLLTDGSFTFARTVTLSNSNPFTAVVGGNAPGSTSTFSGNINTTSDTEARAKKLQLFANAADTTVIFSGAIGANPDPTAVTPVEKTGDGTVVLTNANNTYDGTTTVTSGTLLVNGALSESTASVTVSEGGILGGTGTIDRPAIINGTLYPGDSLAADTTNELTFGDTLTFGDSALAAFQLGGTAENAFDKIIVGGALTLGGTINVTLVGGFSPAAGDVFDLFDFGSISAAGFSVANDLNLPALDGGLSWDTDSFLTNGTIGVVPEPGTACSLLGGVGILLGLRRFRQRR